MDKLKELTQIFENIEIDEKQENAIREFFTLFSESVKEKVSSEYEEKIQALNEELEAAKSSASDDELESFEQDAEKAFELFKEDAEKAAMLMLEDAKEEHAKQLAEALDKLYEDVESRATEDFKSSKEFAALVNVIRAVSPLVVSDDKKSLLEEIETLKKENEALKADNTGLSRKEIIASLVEGFSEEHKKTMIEFMEGSKTEDEIYERFNANASFIESKSKSGDADGLETHTKKRFKTKKELKEEKKETMSEDAPLISSETKEESGLPVSEEHIELVGADVLS